MLRADARGPGWVYGGSRHPRAIKPNCGGLIYGLSVFSIVQASTILVAQRHGELEARHRDEAMHAKLDSLLKGVDKADDRLIGIEREVEELN